MSYEEFDDASYTSLRKSLLRLKGSDAQKRFLEVLRSSKDFSKWIRERVNIEQGNRLAVLDEAMTESEFKDAPKSTEWQIFESWKSIPAASACRVTFWGFMTLRHIEENKIQSSFLAANGGASGLEHIDRVLTLKVEDEEKINRSIDSAVRAVLRRMSGLPEARGNKSVYVNCPFARAWWRRYLADEVCENTDAKLADVIKVLRYSQQYWEDIISLVVSKNSVLGDVKVRTALVWALAELVNDEENDYLFKAKALENIRRLIGIRSAWQELGVFSVRELKELIKENFL